MGINKRCENLIFKNGSKIKVSRKADTKYFDTVDWHTYVKALVSLRDGDAATASITRCDLGENGIAFESGFSSISSFNRAFRKVKGCSPSEFRATMVD